jgi:hypothetical protein
LNALERPKEEGGRGRGRRLRFVTTGSKRFRIRVMAQSSGEE